MIHFYKMYGKFREKSKLGKVLFAICCNYSHVWNCSPTNIEGVSVVVGGYLILPMCRIGNYNQEINMIERCNHFNNLFLIQFYFNHVKAQISDVWFRNFIYFGVVCSNGRGDKDGRRAPLVAGCLGHEETESAHFCHWRNRKLSPQIQAQGHFSERND